MTKITAKEAQKIAKRKQLCLDEDGKSYYAYSTLSDELYSFDNKKERDEFIVKGE